MELDPQVSPEEIMSRKVEQGCESWTFLLQVVTQQWCNGHCPCDSAQARLLKQQLYTTLVAAQWPGDTALTLPLFWRWSTASSVFLVGARGRAFTLSFPSLMSILASVDVKQNVYFQAFDCPSVPLQDYSS